MVSPARALATAAEIVPVPGRTVIVWCGTACAGRALAAQVVRAAPRIDTSVARSFRRAVRCLIVDLNMDVSLSVPTPGCRRPEMEWSVVAGRTARTPLELLCAPNFDVDHEFSLTFGGAKSTLTVGPYLAPPLD